MTTIRLPTTGFAPKALDWIDVALAELNLGVVWTKLIAAVAGGVATIKASKHTAPYDRAKDAHTAVVRANSPTLWSRSQAFIATPST
jgi:hypothetical protein